MDDTTVVIQIQYGSTTQQVVVPTSEIVAIDVIEPGSPDDLVHMPVEQQAPAPAAVAVVGQPMDRYVWAGGGAGVVLGSVLPWASVSAGILNRTTVGTDGDGVYTLILGVLIFAAAYVGKGRAPVVGMTLSAVAVAACVVEYLNIRTVLWRLDSNVAGSIGIGIWILGIGAGAALIGSFRTWRLARAR